MKVRPYPLFTYTKNHFDASRNIDVIILTHNLVIYIISPWPCTHYQEKRPQQKPQRDLWWPRPLDPWQGLGLGVTSLFQCCNVGLPIDHTDDATEEIRVHKSGHQICTSPIMAMRNAAIVHWNYQATHINYSDGHWRWPLDLGSCRIDEQY